MSKTIRCSCNVCKGCKSNLDSTSFGFFFLFVYLYFDWGFWLLLLFLFVFLLILQTPSCYGCVR